MASLKTIIPPAVARDKMMMQTLKITSSTWWPSWNSRANTWWIRDKMVTKMILKTSMDQKFKRKILFINIITFKPRSETKLSRWSGHNPTQSKWWTLKRPPGTIWRCSISSTGLRSHPRIAVGPNSKLSNLFWKRTRSSSNLRIMLPWTLIKAT